MSVDVKMLLADVDAGLRRIYGARLRGTYLYGSRARGDAGPESDADILIVLDRLESYDGEIERTNQLVSDLSLEYSVSISRVFVAERDWRDKDSPFLASAREDAMAA